MLYMKKILTLFLAVGIAATAAAIPARRGSFTVKNSDGTLLTLSLRGDETFHYYVTPEGTPMRQNDQGDWETDLRDVTSLHRTALARRNAGRQQLAQHMRKAMRAVRAPYRTGEQTTKRGLLILVNFQDTKMINGDKSSSIFNQMLNAIGNPYDRNYGSIREYFLSQSYGQLDIEFDVAGPVTVSKEMAYYGEDEGDEGFDAHPGEMVAEACQLVDKEVNFANYDWDGDGVVENVYVVYAGYAQSSGAPANTVWPHQWQLSDADCLGKSLELDGVKVDTYACGSELYGMSGSTLDGIGTMCHEYSHCLGLPDFYDTNYVSFGMSLWSLMDEGCYLGDGFCPSGYTAYERWYCGWLTPVELKEPTTITAMKCIEDHPEAYILYNDQNPNEYYMLANHQQVGWDSEAYGHGMMILHVDYDQKAWQLNTINNDPKHQRMTFIPADNKLSFSNMETDLWPSSMNITALTDESIPAAKLFNANTDGEKFMHKPITDIIETENEISFAFMGGGATPIPAPTELAAAVVSATGFTAQWGAVEGAVSYNLLLTETYDDGQEEVDIEDAMLLWENFDYFWIDSDKDGSRDLKDILDQYTVEPGWTGQKVYEGVLGAKLGSSSAKGYLTTPVLTCSTGNVTVYLNACDWFNYAKSELGEYKPDGSTIDIIVQDVMGKELQKKNVEAPDYLEASHRFFPEFVVDFTDVPDAFKLCISTTAGGKRIYLQRAIFLDGTFTLDQVNTLFDDDEVKASAPAARRQLTAVARAPKHVPVTLLTTYSGITTNSYVLKNLKPGVQYTYRVQAVDTEGNKSGWSKETTVTLPENLDAIDAVIAGVTSRQGGVYDLSGRRHEGFLPRGIYVRDGRKFIVR